MNLKRTVIGAALLVGFTSASPSLHAEVLVSELYDPFFALPGQHVKYEGWLEFINPREHPNLIGFPFPATPPGQIQTEEYTGWTESTGVDRIELGDSDITAGDRADFDWVQENRPCETGGVCNNAPQPVNHPGQVGAMGWTIGQTEGSLHIDPGTGAQHDDGQAGPTHSDEQNPQGPLPHFLNNDYPFEWFNAVDVFSIISVGQDNGVAIDPATGAIIGNLRAAALDYELAFGNSVTNIFSPGVLSIVWIPGWTNATQIDDFVARWVPLFPGQYDLVAIEPIEDQRTEIDAIKGILIPEPGILALLGIGLAGLGLARSRKA